MKMRLVVILLTVSPLLIFLIGCVGGSANVSPKSLVTITIWHVFDNETGSSMNDMVSTADAKCEKISLMIT